VDGEEDSQSEPRKLAKKSATNAIESIPQILGGIK